MAFKIADGFVEIHGEVDEEQIRRSAKRAGDSSGDHFSRAFTNAVGRAPIFARGEGFTPLGRRSSRRWFAGFAAGLLEPSPEALRTLRTGIPSVLASPIGLAALSIAATFVASFVAAVIGSATLGLVGVALLGLGAFGVRASEQVGAAWERAGRRISDSLAEAAQSLVGPFTEAADAIGTGFVLRIAPRLREIFAGLAPSVAPLVESVIATVERLLAGIAPHMDQLVQGFLIPAAAELPRLGDMMADFLNVLIANGPTFAVGLSNILDLLELILRVLGPLLVSATNVFNAFSVGTSLALAGLRPFQDELNLLARNPIEGWLFGVAKGMALFGFEIDKGSKAILRTKDSFPSLIDATQQFTTAQDLATMSMSSAIAEAGGLREALDLLAGKTLTARAAARNFEEAIDAAAASVKDNGKNLDINTEKGRANQAALDAIATAALDLADATFESTKESKGHKSAQEAAIEVLKDAREQLIESAVQMGLSREKARKLADEILGIPKEWRTRFSSNADDARDEVNDYRDAIMSVPQFRRTTLLNQIITEQFGVNAPTVERFGGLHMAQHGLINLGTSRMFPAGDRTLFGFREPATGGEAFIAKNAPRDRSLAILAEAARWHKAALIPMEKAATTMASAAGRPTASSMPVIIENHIHIGNEVVRVVRTEIDLYEEGAQDRLAARAAA